MFFSGMVTTTNSPLRAASTTDTGLAPVSAAKSTSDFGPREFATETSCPKAVKRRVRVLPISPVPMIPIFIFLGFILSTLVQATRHRKSKTIQRTFRQPPRYSTESEAFLVARASHQGRGVGRTSPGLRNVDKKRIFERARFR